MSDPTVEYHLQRWVKQGLVVRAPRRLYGRTVYHKRARQTPQIAHQYRLAKLTHHLLLNTPPGKLVAPSSIQGVDGVQPDLVLTFYGHREIPIYIEYQTRREAWTTARKITAYRASGCEGLKLFFVERSDAFLVSLAQQATTGDFCFANPDVVLASAKPWSEPLFYFGGSPQQRLPLLQREAQGEES